jgi:hypothetical protein
MKLFKIQSFLAFRHFLPLGPNILLSTLFSDIRNPYSSLSVRDQVSHTLKEQVKL